MRARIPVADRLWARVRKDGPVPAARTGLAPCWLWTGPPNADGYGAINVYTADGRCVPRYVHRVAYELEVGPIPDGREIDHLCLVRNCVNPAHLEALTVLDHRRRTRAGRSSWVTERPVCERPVHMQPATRCRKGLHDMVGDNVVTETSGRRRCRSCKQDRQRREYADGRHPSSPAAPLACGR